MRRHLWTKLTCLMLCLCMVLPMFTACSNKNSGDIVETTEAYYTSLTVDYKSDGEYKGNFAFSDEIDDKFTEIDAKDFTLSACNNLEEETSANLTNFTVTKTNEKTIELKFKSPLGYDENLQYLLMSDKAVTEKGNKVVAIIYVSAPEPDIDITYTGAYRGTEKITLTATLEEGWKFATDINDIDLTLPMGMDLTIEVVRESDTKIIFTISDIPSDFTGTSINFTLEKSSIDSEFAEDIFLNIDFMQPEITIDPSSVSYDEETNVLTVGKVSLPEGATGKENGISISDIFCYVSEQAYDSNTNSYSFKLAYNDEYSEITKDLDKKNHISNLDVKAVLNIEGEEVKYGFVPYNVISGIKSNVQTDEENGTLTIELIPYNATFKDGLLETDITITGSEDLTNFKLESISTDKIVYTADYTDTLTSGVALTFTMAGTTLNTSFGLDSYSLMAYIPAFLGDRDIDWADLATELATSAASGLGSAIGGSVAEFVLPYVYDFLGVDTSNPQLKAIESSINKLTFAIKDLTNDVGDISEYIEASTNKTILDSFQTLEDRLLSSTLSLLSNGNVINYVSYLQNTVGSNYKEIVENEAGHRSFEKFLEYYKSCYGGSLENAVRTTEDDVLGLYNALIYYANKSSVDYQSFCGSYCEFSMYWKYTSNPKHKKLDHEEVYKILKGAKKYSKTASLNIPTLERDSNFESAVAYNNYNNEYINNVVNFGNRILGTASGTSAGVIDLFFNVVDTMYNFESQTITPKKSFVSKLQSIYLTSAAIALQYCDAIGDVGNSSLIRSNVKAICAKIEKAFSEIEELEATAKKGNDRILVSNQYISKDLNMIDLKATINYTVLSAYSVSEDTIRSMVNRAQKRKISLATDMKQAGFKKVTASSGEEYLYLTKDTESFKDDYTIKSFGTDFLATFGKSYRVKNWYTKATFVSQTGSGDAVVHRDYELRTQYASASSLWSKTKWEKVINGGYNYMIGFQSPKS